jgi:tRNA-specific 2-thiouridylase
MTESAEKIMVALSGGVDSAVAALLLLRSGQQVEALHMTNWDDGGPYCTSGQDLAEARRVCADLGIVLHEANFSAEYREEVFSDFLSQLRRGLTPNPDVVCNKNIKFAAFLDYAKRLGASRIATGHYARVTLDPEPRLLCAEDADKDQTYFLHGISRRALEQTLFPLGDLPKSQVRQIAQTAGLANHARRDSTGLCFVGERPFREFIGQYVSPEPGPIRTDTGVLLGEHTGLPFYTLGQRAGLGIGGQRGLDAAPWYVAEKRLGDNALIVVQGHDHPLLYRRNLVVGDLHWLARPPDRGVSVTLHCRIRHRHAPAPCTVQPSADGQLAVQFDTPQRAPTPGQYAVFYRDGECLGGGVILRGN